MDFNELINTPYGPAYPAGQPPRYTRLTNYRYLDINGPLSYNEQDDVKSTFDTNLMNPHLARSNKISKNISVVNKLDKDGFNESYTNNRTNAVRIRKGNSLRLTERLENKDIDTDFMQKIKSDSEHHMSSCDTVYSSLYGWQ